MNPTHPLRRCPALRTRAARVRLAAWLLLVAGLPGPTWSLAHALDHAHAEARYAAEHAALAAAHGHEHPHAHEAHPALPEPHSHGAPAEHAHPQELPTATVAKTVSPGAALPAAVATPPAAADRTRFPSAEHPPHLRGAALAASQPRAPPAL